MPTAIFSDHPSRPPALLREAEAFVLAPAGLYAIDGESRDLIAVFEPAGKSFLLPDGTLLCRWEGGRRWRNATGTPVTGPLIKADTFTDELCIIGAGRELKRHHHDFSLYYSSGHLMASFNWSEIIYNLAEARDGGWQDLRSDDVFDELVIAPPAWSLYRAIMLPKVVTPGPRSRPSSLAGRLLPAWAS